ncbi:MAG: NUDIX domain-containing protein [Anaerolineales bacterium]
MTIGRFIGGVGAVIYRKSDGRYLLLQRSPQKDFAQSIWEPVTGRLEQGEGFVDALYREVMEEIGIAVQPMVILGTTHFYRGNPQPENELIGVVFLCQPIEEDQILISTEHARFVWVNAAEATALLTDNSPPTLWTRRIIQRAEHVRQDLSPTLIEYFQQTGFELG